MMGGGGRWEKNDDNTQVVMCMEENKMSQRSQLNELREKCKEENIKLSQNAQTLHQRLEGVKYQEAIIGGVGVTSPSNEETNFIKLLDRFTSSKETENVILMISKS